MTDLESLYKDLHAHPELGFQEHRTAGLAAERMRAIGAEVTEGIGGTGVAAVLRNGDGATVWLRADMDGLPVREETGLDYASTATATTAAGDEVPVMHACGHDMHVTWLIGAMERLAATREAWSGTVVAIFQPSEESIGGAAAMIADGLVDRVPRPDAVLGQHVAPLPAGAVSVTSGPAMAGADSLVVTFTGRGGHGSRPETTIDPIVAAAAAVGRLQTIASREVSPDQLAVVTVGSFHAGSRPNIIPGEARLELSVRSIESEVRERILASIRRIVAAEASAAGMTVPPTVEVVESAPATVNDAEAAERVRTAFRERFGQEAVMDWGRVAGSEDVGVLATAAGAPLMFWFTGGGDPQTVLAAIAAGRVDQDIPSNHSPLFAPVLHPTIEVGVESLVAGALAWVGRQPAPWGEPPTTVGGDA